jgi:hypothetical protein
MQENNSANSQDLFILNSFMYHSAKAQTLPHNLFYQIPYHAKSQFFIDILLVDSGADVFLSLLRPGNDIRIVEATQHSFVVDLTDKQIFDVLLADTKTNSVNFARGR